MGVDRRNAGRCSVTSNQVFVDLTQGQCSLMHCPSGDLSTECSDRADLEDFSTVESDSRLEVGSNVDVHVDIDEDDDDVFFSLHKQDGLDVHVDIDQEDDDVFFSLHRRNAAAVRALPVSNAARQTLACESDISSVAVPASTHSLANSADTITEIAETADQAACGCTQEEYLPQGSDGNLCVPHRGSAHSIASRTPLDESCARVVLRSTSVTAVEQPVAKAGILAELRSGRAQGVRNYLAKKLTQEVDANKDA